MKLALQISGIAINCIAAALLGWLLATSYGRGLAPPAVRVVDTYAQFENVRLPIGARTAAGLKSFVIRVRDRPDDFARVYVNNRQVMLIDGMKEGPFMHITWQDKQKADENVRRFTVDRATPADLEVDVRRWLRPGVNWIMVELENTRWGACSMTVEFAANTTQLEGSPHFIPAREEIGGNLSNSDLLQRLNKLAIDTIPKREFGIRPEHDALCARLIFAFRLH